MSILRDPFVSALAARLGEPLPGSEAHLRFSPRPPRGGAFPRDVPPNARPAAALILLYPADGGWHIPLTVRRADLPDHAGQISLPGGRIDAGETPEAAALREAAEEVGVDPGAVTLLGALSPLYVLVSRFVITPFVGVAAARPDFRVAEREVAELIEAPLASLQNPSALAWGHRTREGYLVDFPYFDLAGHQVWGATAMVLGEFVSLLDPGFGPPPVPPRPGT
jgi:8-oxo-dGTP pyrophosphatase MutT (NUDIX family)